MQCDTFANRSYSLLYNRSSRVLQRGANVIMPRTEAVNGNAEQLRTFTTEPNIGLVSTTGGISFDAAAHFGCNRTQHGHPPELSYAMCRHKVVLTRVTAACSGLLTTHSSIACDTHAPAVALPAGTFTPVHLHSGVFTRDAFWALPSSLLGDSEAMLAWSLVVQRLLWLSGNQIVVRRCATSLNATASIRLASEMTRLNEWQCKDATMKQCILDLITSTPALVKDAAAVFFGYWVEALVKIDYEFPLFNVSVREGCDTVVLHAVDHSVPTLDRRLHAELYSPVTNLDKITAVYKETCDRPNQTLPSYEHVKFAQPWTQFDDILLVITFNNPHYESIPYVETLYRPFFPNILYCGSSSVNLNQSAGIDNFTFSFISYENIEGHAPGSFNYKCMITAMLMGYDVQGVLVASDDLLLLVHRLSDMKRDLVWYVPKIHTFTGDFTNLLQCKYGSCNIKPIWVPWAKYKKVTMDAMAEIRANNKSATMSACYRRLLSENGAPARANGALSDIFYIPSKLWQSYIDFLRCFFVTRCSWKLPCPL